MELPYVINPRGREIVQDVRFRLTDKGCAIESKGYADAQPPDEWQEWHHSARFATIEFSIDYIKFQANRAGVLIGYQVIEVVDEREGEKDAKVYKHLR